MDKINKIQKVFLGVTLILATLFSCYLSGFKNIYSCLFIVFITLPIYTSSVVMYYTCLLTNYDIATIVKVIWGSLCILTAGDLNLYIYVKIVSQNIISCSEKRLALPKIGFILIIIDLILVINAIIYDKKIKKLEI